MGGRWIVRGGALLVGLGVAVGAWGVARGAHHAVYDEFLLPPVMHRIAGDARAPEEVVRGLQDSVHLNVRLPFGAPVQGYPTHPATDHVLYYLGLVQLSQLRDAEAAIRTLEQVLERYPGTVCGHEVTYLLARAHAAANHCAAAAALYRRVIDANGGGREDATERLRHLACA